MKVLKKIEKIARNGASNPDCRCYHIAAIFKGNEIFSIGQNSNKTHPKIQDYQYHPFSRLHAELAACIKFGNTDCRKYSIAVIRVDRNGKLNQSCPCDGCKSVINQLRFKKVYYTNEQGEWEYYTPAYKKL